MTALQHNSGDPCPNGCGGQVFIRASRPSGCGEYYIRYMRCTVCKWAEPELVPTGRIHTRRRQQHESL